MVEQQIKERLPELHDAISSLVTSEETWQQVFKDLSELNWLSLTGLSVESFIQGYFSHMERFMSSQSSKLAFFQTFTMNRVKLFLYDSLFSFISHKENCKDLCKSFKSSLKSLSFFQSSKESLSSIETSQLYEHLKSIEQDLVSLKNYLNETAILISKPLHEEFDKELQELIDECFYNESLEANKLKLKEDEDCRRIMKEYKPSVYFSSSRYPNNIYNSYHKLENVYIGQLTQEKKRQGYGKMFFSNLNYYEGYWANDKPEGQGLCTWKDGGKYLGELKAGRLEGKGKRLYSNGNFYEGSFVGGRRKGKGKMQFKNGDSYDGEWSADEMQGSGMYFWGSGDNYIGEFNRDKKHGKGTLTLSTGEVFQGTWTSGVYKNDES
jgi:hypothetical protein